MTIRIPKRLNTLLDWAAHHPLPLTAVAGFGLALLLLPDHSLAALVLTGATCTAVVAIAHHLTVTLRLRHQVADLEWDLGVHRAEVDRLRAGDASAATQRIHVVGDQPANRRPEQTGERPDAH